VASDIWAALDTDDCTCSTTGFDYTGTWAYDFTGECRPSV
jgi:hypothetical protein